MIIPILYGYIVRIHAHGWRVETGDKDFIGIYDCLTEAVNAAAEHYARKLIATEHKDASLAEAADIVTGVKSRFYSAMRGGSPEEYL